MRFRGGLKFAAHYQWHCVHAQQLVHQLVYAVLLCALFNLTELLGLAITLTFLLKGRSRRRWFVVCSSCEVKLAEGEWHAENCRRSVRCEVASEEEVKPA